MKPITTIKMAVLMLLIVFCTSSLYAQSDQEQESKQIKPFAIVAKKPRIDFIKKVEFYLKDGTLVSGKMILENKNEISLEHLHKGQILVSTYSKRKIDTRTMHTRKIPEYKYYIELAEYFSGRTWDFRNDVDDFIQAVRCYEKAKAALVSAEREQEIEQIDEKINELRRDKQVWEKEIESRARLKKLEFEATIEDRIKEFEDRLDQNSEQFTKVVEDFNRFIEDKTEESKQLERSISGIEKNMLQKLKVLKTQIENNRRLIYDIDSYGYRYNYPRRYYHNPR